MRRLRGLDLFAADARRFNVAFAALFGLIVIAGLGVMAGLAGSGRLPAPPLTATNCIDEKFQFLSTAPLEDVDLLAVGSSVTWRNLRMDELARVRPDITPLNAAPCYLYVNQIAYLTEFLLARMPAVETVLTVLAPRDFEDCRDGDTRFFDAAEAGRYLFEGQTPWHLYFTNLRPLTFARDAWQLADMRYNPESWRPVAMDRYGSSPLRVRVDWRPKPAIDAGCFAHLARLEAVVAGHGARLVVVNFPTMPEWRRMFDPDGAIAASLRQRIGATLRDGRTVVINGDQFAARDEQFADPAHFLWDETAGFTRFIAANAFARDRAGLGHR